jgi:CrcB protein
VDDDADLPLDPDVDAAANERHRPAGAASSGPFARPRRSRLPRIHPGTVLAVAIGGVFGGLLRYEIGVALPAATDAFPVATFLVNAAGAFVLALVLVLVLEVLPPTTYVRPLLGTGFCGALTTFSSVATGVDQLVARGHAGLAAGYVAASLAAGLTAAVLGIALGRSVAAARQKEGS